MKQRIRVTLPSGWADVSRENPEGPATFARTANEASGALQVSHAEYKGGVIPDPGPEDLVALAVKAGRNQPGARLLRTDSGRCQFGIWGTAVYTTDDSNHFQVWHLSNGRDFMFATYISCTQPEEIEVSEAHAIVNALTLVRRTWLRW